MPNKSRISEGQAVDEASLELFSKVAGWGGCAASRRVRNILKGTFRNGAKVLDVGTGPGTIPVHLQRVYTDTCFMGLDVSAGMLKKADGHRKRMKVKTVFLSGNGETLPFRDYCLDVVTSFFTLHHMDQPEKFLKEANRVLKPDGRLLIIDFRRDMPRVLYSLLNGMWQLFFFFSSGRFGFRDSAFSAWQPDEIERIIARNDLNRFGVRSNPMELWIVTKGKKVRVD